MATYQEQIAKHEKSKTAKALTSLAELGLIGDALGILVREKIIENDDRFNLMRLYVSQHPEINQAIAEAAAARS